jgi:hypothetical protein
VVTPFETLDAAVLNVGAEYLLQQVFSELEIDGCLSTPPIFQPPLYAQERLA